MTYAEAIYICSDLVKAMTSDDSYITEDHIKFLLSKYRALILKQTYSNIKREIPSSNYQTLCLDLEYDTTNLNLCGGNAYLISKDEIPDLMEVGIHKVTSGTDFFSSEISLVSNERFKYVGENKYTQNTIYATISPDNHLYLKSSNGQFKYLKCVRFTGIFEDADKAAELSCDAKDNKCADPMDSEFAIEESLFPNVMKMVIQDIMVTTLRAEDDDNNAKDDMGNIYNYLRTRLKPSAQKEYERLADEQ